MSTVFYTRKGITVCVLTLSLWCFALARVYSVYNNIQKYIDLYSTMREYI